MNQASVIPTSPEHFQVQGMTCQHCVRAVRQVIEDSDARALVEIDLASGRVTVQSSLSREHIAELIREEGYSVAV